jgi:putative transposase
LIRTYTFRLKVTNNQDKLLINLLIQLCELYNLCLEQYKYWTSKHPNVNFASQCRELTELRQNLPEYNQFPCNIQQDCIKRIQLAFNNFFRRVKRGEKPGYPRFRSVSRYDSFDCSYIGFKLKGNNEIYLTSIGTFKLKTRCKIKGTPKQLHVKRIGNKWIGTVVCDIGAKPKKVEITNKIGIDVGVNSLVALSNSTKITNPKWLENEEATLANTSRNLSKKKKGSNNRIKAKECLRKQHQRIKGKRSSYLHSISNYLVKNFDVICFENLDITNLTSKETGNKKLRKNILDAAWNILLLQIIYKVEYTGKYHVEVPSPYTSQTCNRCLYVNSKNRNSSKFLCLKCNYIDDADVNAAKNILRIGMSLLVVEKVLPKVKLKLGESTADVNAIYST